MAAEAQTAPTALRTRAPRRQSVYVQAVRELRKDPFAMAAIVVLMLVLLAAVAGPVLTIRKFRSDLFSLSELTQVGTVSEATAEVIAACVRARLNIVISGGTGTGKTTLLNALSAFIPERERIVTIEDPLEIRLQQKHVISMEARPPSAEGAGEVTQRMLLRNALRMRPDRIIVGEARGACKRIDCRRPFGLRHLVVAHEAMQMPGQRDQQVTRPG